MKINSLKELFHLNIKQYSLTINNIVFNILINKIGNNYYSYLDCSTNKYDFFSNSYCKLFFNLHTLKSNLQLDLEYIKFSSERKDNSNIFSSFDSLAIIKDKLYFSRSSDINMLNPTILKRLLKDKIFLKNYIFLELNELSYSYLEPYHLNILTKEDFLCLLRLKGYINDFQIAVMEETKTREEILFILCKHLKEGLPF